MTEGALEQPNSHEVDIDNAPRGDCTFDEDLHSAPVVIQHGYRQGAARQRDKDRATGCHGPEHRPCQQERG